MTTPKLGSLEASVLSQISRGKVKNYDGLYGSRKAAATRLEKKGLIVFTFENGVADWLELTDAGRAALGIAPAPHVAPLTATAPEWLTKEQAKIAAHVKHTEPPSAPLTGIERDLLVAIAITPLPLRFADHLKPESFKAFESLRDSALIKFNRKDDLYHITDAGVAALDTAKGGAK